MRSITLCVASTLVLAGCATTAPTLIDTSRLAEASPMPSKIVAITREYLPADQELPTTFSTTLPTAYLLISPDQKKAGRRMCEAWLGLPTDKAVKTLNPSAEIAHTYWLLGQASKPTDGCKALVDKYDFAKADLFRTANGLPLGSLLAVRFPDNRTFYVDLTKANAKQNRQMLLSWYVVASTTDGASKIVQSDSVAARMQRVICQDKTGIVGNVMQAGAGMLGPFGFIVGVGKEELCNVNIVEAKGRHEVNS